MALLREALLGNNNKGWHLTHSCLSLSLKWDQTGAEFNMKSNHVCTHGTSYLLRLFLALVNSRQPQGHLRNAADSTPCHHFHVFGVVGRTTPCTTGLRRLFGLSQSSRRKGWCGPQLWYRPLGWVGLARNPQRGQI